jgi:cell division transport system permease protein
MWDWGRVRFFWAEVGQNFTRNVPMALTAIGTVAISIVLLGVFLYLRTSFDSVMKTLVDQVALSLYLRDDARPADVHALAVQLSADPRVDSVRYVSKKQAIEHLRQTLRGQFNLNLLNTNPLPNTIVVHARHPADIPMLAQELGRSPVVAAVNYGQGLTEKLLRAERWLSVAGLIVVGLLLVATALIIYNTIRLTVFARQREIHIMQLVGATGWTVRWPFVFEGLLSGLCGALLGLGALALAYHSLAPAFVVNLPFLPFHPASVSLVRLSLELLTIGVLVGMLSSLLSVSRYVEVA